MNKRKLVISTFSILLNFSAFSQSSELVDVEGNSYNTVQIGNQLWMKENLKTTKFNDGSDIPLIINSKEWKKLKSPAYCWYDNDEASYRSYGVLYNWYTINTEKLCPIGWHVPTVSDWDIIINYLGGKTKAGGKLKETGFQHWKDPNVGATNESGFTAIAGGLRLFAGDFVYVDEFGYWWCYTGKDAENVSNRSIFWNAAVVGIPNTKGLKQIGISVRCLKD